MKLFFCAAAVTVAAAAAAGQGRTLLPLLVVRLADGTPGTPDVGPRTPDLGPGTAGVSSAQLSPLPVTRLDQSGASATLDSVRPLSLRFAQPLPVRDVLLLLVRDTGLSLVTEPGVDGTFTGELSGVTLRQAFDLVLHPQGLDYTIERSAIRVFRRRTETRIFDVNVAAATRRGSGGDAFSSVMGGQTVNGARASIEWTADADPFEALSRGIASMLSADGRFALDRRAGVVQVTDYADRLERVALYVESIERRLRRQVEIVARVIEVTLSDPAAPAVDWSAAIDKSRTTSPAGTPAIDFTALMKALGEQGTVSVLASPRVTAMHNEPAIVRVGTQDVTFERHGDSERANPVLDGFVLAVVPHISADGVITINVSPSVTQRTGEVRSRDRQTAPVLAVDGVSTAVRLRDGETLVMPGLRREREQRIGAGGLASLFRREETRRTTSEIAVLLTPKVM